MKRFAQGKILVCALFACVNMAYGDTMKLNQLHKVFHHQGPDKENKAASGQALDIDLGKVVFYFSEEPTMNPLPTSLDKDTSEMVFFLPKTALAQGAQKLIERSPFYSIRVEDVHKPIDGVKVFVSYDPKKVQFTYDFFESVSLQKGVKFNFYNKTLIEALQKKNKAMLRTAMLTKPGVIVDCGHGGTDSGAIGYGAIQEKDVTFRVGMQLAQLLKKKGVEVFLTRAADTTTPLDERTTFANACQANLLVSIHANSAPKKTASGIETFCLHDALFNQRYCSADECQKEFIESAMNTFYANGQSLASSVQGNILKSVRQKYAAVADRKVKYAAGQVLIGTRVPSILVELGFLSNKQEAVLLADSDYQKLLAHGIYNGIVSYLGLVKKV